MQLSLHKIIVCNVVHLLKTLQTGENEATGRRRCDALAGNLPWFDPSRMCWFGRSCAGDCYSIRQ